VDTVTAHFDRSHARAGPAYKPARARSLDVCLDVRGPFIDVRSEAERAKALQLARETVDVTAVNDRLVIR
jgi:hypothetical protein